MHQYTEEEKRQLMRQAVASLRRFGRAVEAMGDATRLTTHLFVCEFGRQWEHPELVLSDEEVEQILARKFGRTLAEIDELPERR